MHNIIITFLAETSGTISTLYAFLNESIIKTGNHTKTQEEKKKKTINKWAREKNDKNINGGKCNCNNNKNATTKHRTKINQNKTEKNPNEWY